MICVMENFADMVAQLVLNHVNVLHMYYIALASQEQKETSLKIESKTEHVSGFIYTYPINSMEL